jgi:hypothetical protein
MLISVSNGLQGSGDRRFRPHEGHRVGFEWLILTLFSLIEHQIIIADQSVPFSFSIWYHSVKQIGHSLDKVNW